MTLVSICAFLCFYFFFFSSRRRHTRFKCDWSSDVCSSDLSHSRWQLYRRAIAVVVPSICYETFGIIIIEAFSVKTPVIVNNLGALPEVVEDSGGGLIYSGPDELAAAMDRLANESGLRRKLGVTGPDA